MKRTITSFILALLCIVVNAQSYTTLPENGANVDMLTDIAITWDESESVTVDPMLMVGGAKVYFVNGADKTFVTDIICGPAGGNSVVLSLMMAATDAGDYLVEISDNMFTVDGVQVAGFNLNYTIGGMPTTTSKFMIEMKDNSLSTMLVSVEPCNELSLNPDVTESIQIIHNKGFGAYYAATYTAEITGANTATLTADKELGEGHYTLVIPKGTFIVDGCVNREIMKEFDLSVVNPATEYTVDPVDGSTLEELVEITITWEKATSIEVNMEKMMGGIIVYQIDGEFKNKIADVFCGPAFGNYVMLSLTSLINTAGDYVVEIPGDMFTVDGTPVPEFSLSYNIPGVPSSTATMSAQQQDATLSTILLTFEPCSYLDVYTPAEGEEEIEAPFIIHNNGFNSSIAATYTITITGENTALLTTDKNLPDGHYTLHVPQSTFLIDGKVNKLALFDFEKSAVESIINDNAPINAYDLRGVQVVNNGTVGDVKSLDAGVYIVNGKKIMVRNNR